MLRPSVACATCTLTNQAYSVASRVRAHVDGLCPLSSRTRHDSLRCASVRIGALRFEFGMHELANGRSFVRSFVRPSSPNPPLPSPPCPPSRTLDSARHCTALHCTALRCVWYARMACPSAVVGVGACGLIGRRESHVQRHKRGTERNRTQRQHPSLTRDAPEQTQRQEAEERHLLHTSCIHTSNIHPATTIVHML